MLRRCGMGRGVDHLQPSQDRRRHRPARAARAGSPSWRSRWLGSVLASKATATQFSLRSSPGQGDKAGFGLSPEQKASTCPKVWATRLQLWNCRTRAAPTSLLSCFENNALHFLFSCKHLQELCTNIND